MCKLFFSSIASCLLQILQQQFHICFINKYFTFSFICRVFTATFDSAIVARTNSIKVNNKTEIYISAISSATLGDDIVAKLTNDDLMALSLKDSFLSFASRKRYNSHHFLQPNFLLTLFNRNLVDTFALTNLCLGNL